MPRLLIAMDNPMVATGYASTCRLTGKEMIKRGWEVYSMAFNGGPVSDTVTDWYGIKIFPNRAMTRDPNAIYGDADSFIKAVKEISPDVILLHNDTYRFSGYMVNPSFPKEIMDKCVFWLPFEGDTPDAPGVPLMERCQAVRFVTEHALGLHAGLLKGKDIGAICHAIDLESFFPHPNKVQAKAETKTGTSLRLDGKFVVSRVDRHQPRKKWTSTLEAFAKFAKGKDDVCLLAKCNPRDMTMWDDRKKEGVDLEAVAKSLGIDDKVFFSDFFFNGPFMAKTFYHPADVFLTTTSGEGWGLSLCEAMACGVPVICPDTPVLPEVVKGGGILCKLRGREWYDPMQVFHNLVDENAVAEKLQWAYDDFKNGGKELARIGAEGRRIAVEKYSPTAVYDQWQKVFASVMEKRDLASIVTVLYNANKEQIYGEDGIERFRESMEKYVKSPYEWLIVDNGSPERTETRSWLAKAAAGNPNIKPILLDTNMGFAGGCNAGIAAAKGEWVFLCNPDCEALDSAKMGLPADFVRMMIDRAKSDSNVGIVGMEINRRDDILTGSMFPYFCNVLITRKCLDAIKIDDGKWFEEEFWPGYYEDSAMCMRVLGKGFKVVDHNVPFWHKSGGTNRHAIEGGKDGKVAKQILATIDKLAAEKPVMADWSRKRGECLADGMQGLIRGNINWLNKKWGLEARQKIKVCFETHIGAAVGFSEIVEGLVPEMHKLGFDVYVNDWSNGSKIEDPLIRALWEKTKKAKEEGTLDDAVHVVAWLMESFLQVDASYKVGMSFCESTKVRPQYLQACNGMDRILTFSDFCRGVQKNSGYASPIHVLPPGVHPMFLNYYERPIRKDKFTFLSVGVSQERKDTRRLVSAFCEQFPSHGETFPECGPDFPYKPGQVELVLKSNNFGELSWVSKEGWDKQANIRTIFTGSDARAGRKDFTRQEMYDLYCEADCLVHPSHGEGVGYPVLESAATGLPVLFTNWSSPAEYLDDSNSYPLPLGPNGTDFVEAYAGHGTPGENGVWANVHIGALKHFMRHVISNRDEARGKGKKAAELMKAKYNWNESARHLMPLLFEWDAERKGKVSQGAFDPLTFARPKLEPVKKGDRVVIDVCSRDRHGYLTGLIMSLLTQTFKDWDIVIQCDDSDESMPNDWHIMSLCDRLLKEGHGWRIIRSHRQGPHMAHDRTLQMVRDDGRKTKLICRIDDDIFVRPDFLERLFEVYLDDPTADVAAVGGVYLNPRRGEDEQMVPKGWETDINYAGKIEPNAPWAYVSKYPPGTKPRRMEHLYSSFMYRVEAASAIGGYCKLFSQIGHREESDFSYRLHLGGWKLFLQPKAVGFHFCAPSGGIRDGAIIDKQALAESDHRIYARRLAYWKKRMELKRTLDAAKLIPVPSANAAGIGTKTVKGKIACVVNGSRVSSIEAAIKRLGDIVDEIYVTCDNQILKTGFPNPNSKVKMIATTAEEVALLTKAVLADGDHEFVMTVSDTMSFVGDPRTLLDDDHDDYVFETYTAYMQGKTVGNSFVEDPPSTQAKIVVGPEVRNLCLITRRRAGAKPIMERILYSDMSVIDDRGLAPAGGKSAMGGELMPWDELASRAWKKVCVYQYPEGKLKEPRCVDMAPEGRLVSIIIPTAGRKRLLKQCVDSIYAHTTTPFEIIVIDNASSDGTEDYLREVAKTRLSLAYYRQLENLGYQKAVNIGVAKARGKYILLFNDDAWVEGSDADGRDWLRVYIDALEADPKLGMVGPHGCDSPALGERILFFWCVMFRKSLWDEVGGLDDVTFRNYGGDDDYVHRVRKAGYSIKEIPTKLRHLMTCIPDHVKKPELAESVVKLKAKWGAK